MKTGFERNNDMYTDLDLYLDEFRNLTVNRSKGKVAPHKAILLISVIDLIESGHYRSNEIAPDATLEKVFSENWKRYVHDAGHYRCVLATPFYHLNYEGFWKLIKTKEYVEREEYSSLSSVRKNFSYALIDKELFDVLQEPSARAKMRDVLIATYLL